MSMKVEQVVALLLQQVLTLKAQVTDQSGLADAVRAINNLANARAQQDTPSLIDVKGLGRPKEFSGKGGILNSGRRRRRHFRWCHQGV